MPKKKKAARRRVRVSISVDRDFWQRIVLTCAALGISPGRYFESMNEYLETQEGGRK